MIFPRTACTNTAFISGYVYRPFVWKWISGSFFRTRGQKVSDTREEEAQRHVKHYPAKDNWEARLARQPEYRETQAYSHSD